MKPWDKAAIEAAASKMRPVASDEENKKLVHAWAHQMRRELPKDHAAQSTLTAIIRHNYVPTFPVSNPLAVAKEAANRDTSAIIFFAIGGALLVTAGNQADAHPIIAAICGVVGLVAQSIAFGRAQPE